MFSQTNIKNNSSNTFYIFPKMFFNICSKQQNSKTNVKTICSGIAEATRAPSLKASHAQTVAEPFAMPCTSSGLPAKVGRFRCCCASPRPFCARDGDLMPVLSIVGRGRTLRCTPRRSCEHFFICFKHFLKMCFKYLFHFFQSFFQKHVFKTNFQNKN